MTEQKIIFLKRILQNFRALKNISAFRSIFSSIEDVFLIQKSMTAVMGTFRVTSAVGDLFFK